LAGLVKKEQWADKYIQQQKGQNGGTKQGWESLLKMGDEGVMV